MAKSKNIEFGAALDRVKKPRTITDKAINRLIGKDPEPETKKTEKAGAKDCRINLRVTTELQSDIEAMAHFNQRTVTAYITGLVKKDIEENESILSTFRKMQEVRDGLTKTAK